MAKRSSEVKSRLTRRPRIQVTVRSTSNDSSCQRDGLRPGEAMICYIIRGYSAIAIPALSSWCRVLACCESGSRVVISQRCPAHKLRCRLLAYSMEQSVSIDQKDDFKAMPLPTRAQTAFKTVMFLQVWTKVCFSVQVSISAR